MRINGINMYSFMSAILFFSIGLLIIKKMRKNTIFLTKNSTTDLMILLALSFVRVLLPLDLSCALIIPSKSVLPFIQKMLNYSIYDNFTIGAALIIMWVMGAVIIVFRESYKIRTEFKQIHSYRVIRSEQVERVVSNCFPNKKMSVVVSPGVQVPMVTGFVHAFIYLPVVSVTDSELELIIKHELQHIIGGDIFIKFFYMCLKAIFWWNPIVHYFWREVDNILELRCDMAVTRRMKSSERHTYLQAILNVIKQMSLDYKNVPVGALQLTNGNVQENLKQRFELILNKPDYSEKRFRFRSSGIIALALICSYLFIVQPSYAPPADEIVNSKEIREDNSYISINDDGKIVVFVDNTPFMIITYQDLEKDPFNRLSIRRDTDE